MYQALTKPKFDWGKLDPKYLKLLFGMCNKSRVFSIQRVYYKEVKDVLKECYGEAPHTLLSVDITDEDKKEYWDKVRPLSWASLDR